MQCCPRIFQYTKKRRRPTPSDDLFFLLRSLPPFVVTLSLTFSKEEALAPSYVQSRRSCSWIPGRRYNLKPSPLQKDECQAVDWSFARINGLLPSSPSLFILAAESLVPSACLGASLVNKARINRHLSVLAHSPPLSLLFALYPPPSFDSTRVIDTFR